MKEKKNFPKPSSVFSLEWDDIASERASFLIVSFTYHWSIRLVTLDYTKSVCLFHDIPADPPNEKNRGKI